MAEMKIKVWQKMTNNQTIKMTTNPIKNYKNDYQPNNKNDYQPKNKNDYQPNNKNDYQPNNKNDYQPNNKNINNEAIWEDNRTLIIGDNMIYGLEEEKMKRKTKIRMFRGSTIDDM